MSRSQKVLSLISAAVFVALLFVLPAALLLSGSLLSPQLASVDSARSLFENPETWQPETTLSVIKILLWILWIYFVWLSFAELRTSKHRAALPLIGPIIKRTVGSMLVMMPIATTATPAIAAVESPTAADFDDDNQGQQAVQNSLNQNYFHNVEFGDSWMSLAQRYLGSPDQAKQLHNLNIGRVVGDNVTVTKQTQVLRSGWRIKVPGAVAPANQGFDFSSFLTGLGVGSVTVAGAAIEAVRRRRASVQATAHRGEYASFGLEINPAEVALRVASAGAGADTQGYEVTLSAGLKIDLSSLSSINLFGAQEACIGLVRSALTELRCANSTSVIVVGSELNRSLKSTVVEESSIDEVNDILNDANHPNEYLTLVLLSEAEYSKVKKPFPEPQRVTLLVVSEHPLPSLKNAISVKSATEAALLPSRREFRPQSLSQPVAEVIDSLVDQQPVWNTIQPPDERVDEELSLIKVMGRVSFDRYKSLSSQQLSLLTFLAVHGPTTKQLLMDLLWDGQLISPKRFANLLAETRKVVGKDILPAAIDGRYKVDGIVTDLDLLKKATAQSNQNPQKLTELERLLGKVDGVPFEGSNRRYWSWVAEHNYVYAEAECLIAEASLTLAELHEQQGQLERAAQVCRHGLRGAPLDENLTTKLAQLLKVLGQHSLAERVVSDWEMRISSLGYLDPSTGPRQELKKYTAPETLTRLEA